MKQHIWSFEFRKGTQVLDHFNATCTECHRKGDELATRVGSVECYAFNEPLEQWQKMGVYRGNRVFTDSFGEDRSIKWDYSGMAPMGKEVVAQ
ncbi:MAG: hypothetical protein J5565_06290 [Muribaculaceae bacterium]|nr:hypothetical protein [Muribaculaceae bacterium]